MIPGGQGTATQGSGQRRGLARPPALAAGCGASVGQGQCSTLRRRTQHPTGSRARAGPGQNAGALTVCALPLPHVLQGLVPLEAGRGWSSAGHSDPTIASGVGGQGGSCAPGEPSGNVWVVPACTRRLNPACGPLDSSPFTPPASLTPPASSELSPHSPALSGSAYEAEMPVFRARSGGREYGRTTSNEVGGKSHLLQLSLP